MLQKNYVLTAVLHRVDSAV